MLKRIKRRLSNTFQVLLTGQLESSKTRSIPAITLDEVAEAKEFFPMEKFFIFGHARSGTTLLTRLVRLHPEVHCNYQAHFFTRPPLLSDMAAEKQVGDWLSRPSNRWNRGRDLTPVALRAMTDFILERDARREGKTIVGDKSPNVLLKGQAVHEMYNIYPDARLIFIVRDGRDTIISQRFQGFIDGAEHLSRQDINIRDSFARNPDPFLKGEKSIFTEKWLRNMTQQWAQNVMETHNTGRELYIDQYLVMLYEDLIRHPFETMKLVWDFLSADSSGLETVVNTEMKSNPDADYQRSKASDLTANLEKGKRGSWKELFNQRDREVFKEIAGEALIFWAYEKDLDW